MNTKNGTTYAQPIGTLTAAALRRRGELMDALELNRRCAAAARLVTMSASYSPEDRADMAADLFLRVWEELTSSAVASYTVTVNAPTSLRGDGAVSYSAKSRAKSKDTSTLRVDVPAWPISAVPKFSVLTGRAANLRRTLDRKRAHDAAAAADAALDWAFIPFLPDEEPELRSTPAAAAALAAEMATAVGNRTRAVYVACYTAARASSGEASDLIAEELDMEPAAYRQSLKRGRDAISAAFPAPHVLADALHVPEGGVALKPSASRTRTHSIGERDAGWRESQRAYGIRPVVVSAAPMGPLPVAPPQWARSLNGASAARLAGLAAAGANRARLKSEADRMRDRLSAGLPAELPTAA